MKLQSIDLNLLVTLDALLTERNVTRAAERLSLGQPATTAALGRLRRLFDDPLLVRHGRVMELTPLAQALVSPLRQILVGVDDLLATTPQFNPQCDHRSFTVVASDYVALVMLRPLLARLDKVAPNVRVVVSAITVPFREMIGRGEADLLLFPPEVDPSLRALPHHSLFSDRYVCVVWNRHPEVRDEITVDMLRRLPYMNFAVSPLTSYVDRQLDGAGIECNVEVSTQSFVLLPFLLRGTRLVTMLPERLVRGLQDAAELRILEPPLPLKPITEAMFWHPRFETDPGHIWLREQLIALADNI